MIIEPKSSWSFSVDTLWSKYSSERGDGGWRFGEEEELLSSGYNCPEPHLHLPLTRPLPPGSREIQLAVPGAYEKPQSVPLQPTVEPGLPATFIFHMNPVLSPRLNIALQEKLLVSHVSELWRGGKSRMSPRRRRLQSAWEVHLSSTLLLDSLLHRVAQVMSWSPRLARWRKQASCSPLCPSTRSQQDL